MTWYWICWLLACWVVGWVAGGYYSKWKLIKDPPHGHVFGRWIAYGTDQRGVPYQMRWCGTCDFMELRMVEPLD